MNTISALALLGPESTVGVGTPTMRMGVPAIPAAMFLVEARPDAHLAAR